MNGFSPNTYLPCLRWKQGEYFALEKLSSESHRSIIPLIEIPEIGFDFEHNEEKRTIDDHIAPIASRIRNKWGKNECFVDLHLIEKYLLLNNKMHPSSFIFSELREKGVLGKPVIWLNQQGDLKKALRDVVNIDKRGFCLRLKIEDLLEQNLESDIHELRFFFKTQIETCDLIIDIGAPSFTPIEEFSVILERLLKNNVTIEGWRSFFLLGTSFPKNLIGIKTGLSIHARNEWILYKNLVQKLSNSKTRIPNFGDYAISHPDVIHVDMRLLKPTANIRYSVPNRWIIVKGKSFRDYGNNQFRELSRQLVESSFFCGRQFSKGDEFIFNCSNDGPQKGNLSTWRWIGTNHHIELATREVSTFLSS